jgi:hypothetical protein
LSAVDDIAVVVAHLSAAGSALYTLCGTRVYYGRLPSGYENTQPALLITRRGGQPDSYIGTVETDLIVKCFGGSSSFAQAEQVYRALRDRLHGNSNTNQSTASGTVVTARETGMGQPITDPETGWPYVLTYYLVAVRPN